MWLISNRILLIFLLMIIPENYVLNDILEGDIAVRASIPKSTSARDAVFNFR